MAVTVYSKPDCVQCEATKRALTEKQIPFDLVDLTADEKSFAFVMELGYRQAPVVVADDKHWAGFRPDLIAALAVMPKV